MVVVFYLIGENYNVEEKIYVYIIYESRNKYMIVCLVFFCEFICC